MSTVVEDDNKRDVGLVLYACTHGHGCSIQHLKPKTILSANSKQVRVRTEYKHNVGPGYQVLHVPNEMEYINHSDTRYQALYHTWYVADTRHDLP